MDDYAAYDLFDNHTRDGVITPLQSVAEPQGGEPLKPVKTRSIATIIIASILSLSTIAAVTVFFLLGVLPPLFLWLVVGIEVIATAILVIVLLKSPPKTHKARFWIATVLSVILILVNISVVKFGTDYLRLGSFIQPRESTSLYDIVALKTGPSTVSELTGSLMAEVGSDPLVKDVRSEVDKRALVTFETKGTWPEAVAAVTNGEVTSMVIQDGFMQVLSEANPETYDSLVILDSFEVKHAIQPTAPTKLPDNSFVVYISGIDSYGSIATRSRSDVNILMAINPDTGKILLVNTPRDFYVNLRDYPGLPDKLTHAGVYGIDISMGTLEDLYGISIDYYLRINFNSLIEVVDALGGVEVESEYDFSAGGYSFTVGTNYLSGEAALAFARERYSFDGGDRVRGQNQQRVIEGIIKKISSPSILLGYDKILSSVQYSMETSMPSEMMSKMVKKQLSAGTNWSTESVSVDGTGASEYTYTYPGQALYVMIPDQETVDAAKAKIAEVLG